MFIVLLLICLWTFIASRMLNAIHKKENSCRPQKPWRSINTWSVKKLSWILNFRGLRIFDFRFFVAICWYSYLSLMSTSSAILNVQFIFDSYFAWTCFGLSSIFTPSVSGTRKNHRGPDLGDTVAETTLLCCFWPKIWYKFFDSFFGTGKNRKQAKTRPSKITVKNYYNWTFKMAELVGITERYEYQHNSTKKSKIEYT